MSDVVNKVHGNMKSYLGLLGFVLSGSDSKLKFSNSNPKPCYSTVVREVSSHLSNIRVTLKFSKLWTISNRDKLQLSDYEDMNVKYKIKLKKI